MPTPLTVDQALRMLDGSEPRPDSDRALAARVLGEHGDHRALPALLTALEDRDWAVRAAAARSLGAVGDARAVGALIARLGDVDNVSCTAARSLGRLKAREAVLRLGQGLSPQTGSPLREAAAAALGQTGDRRAVEALIEALGDSSPRVRRAAAGALERLGEGGVAQAVFSAFQGHAAGAVGLAMLAADGDRRVVGPLPRAGGRRRRSPARRGRRAGRVPRPQGGPVTHRPTG